MKDIENKDIRPRNKNGELHGYQEYYTWMDNEIWLRGVYKNGEPLGYCKNNPDFGGIGDKGTLVEFYIR